MTPKTAVKPLDIHSLLTLPRPAASIPNASGSLAIWPSTNYDFATNRTNKSISLLSLPSTDDRSTTEIDPALIKQEEPKVILDGLHSTEAVWLDNTTVIYLSLPPSDASSFSSHKDQPSTESDAAHSKRVKALLEEDPSTLVCAFDVETSLSYQIGVLPVQISNLTLSPSSSPKTATLLFSAPSYSDGDLYSYESKRKDFEEKKEGSDGRVYDKTFVRHWDEWIDPDGSQQKLFFVKLTKLTKDPEEEEVEGFQVVEKPVHQEGRWRFVGNEGKYEAAAFDGFKKPTIYSPLKNTALECPVGAFGGADDFSLSPDHLVFHAKDPHINYAWHTRTQVYLVPLDPRTGAEAKPKQLTVGTQGACSSPVFSQDGKRVAWLEMREDGYEADKNRLMIYEVETGERWTPLEDWDRSPKKVTWCPSGEKVYLLTDEAGHTKLFQLALPLPSTSYTEVEPTKLTHKHTISSFTPLSTTSLLLTINSFVSPNALYSLSVSPPPTTPNSHPPKTSLHPLASLTPTLTNEFSLHAGEEFVFGGAKGRSVHGFILFPPGFEEGKKKGYPLAFLVHGGPQSAWNDAWSTRWNPNSYASKGYITVAINPTGSTGYGQEFCDDIKNNWGGSPFHDLLAGLEFVKTAYPEIDPERMAMLGASYGGFMANWIQGHNDQMKFKCIVCHDGVFSTSATWFGTEELYFPEREFGGTPWTVPGNYHRWNPQNFITKWKTPQLVIHSARDYRLTESEGVGVFNTLQRLGVPSRFLHFPSENHWILKPQNGVKWHEEVFRWIDEWTAEVKTEEREEAEVKKEEKKVEVKKEETKVKKSGYEVQYIVGGVGAL